MVGSLGSVAQFEDNIKRRYYYVPAKYIKDSDLPIRYIALYQSKNRFREYAGVRYYGEVTYMQKVKRKDIDFPMSRNNGDEMYYAFRIKAWKALPAPIVQFVTGNVLPGCGMDDAKKLTKMMLMAYGK